MSNARCLNSFLSSTTALINVGLVSSSLILFTVQQAQAADINTPTTVQYNLSDNETLTITSPGNIITASSYGVFGDGDTNVNVVNNANSTIQGIFSGIYIQSNSLIGTLTNDGTIASTGGQGISLDSSTVGDLTNNLGGDIVGDANGLLFLNNSSLTGELTNKGSITGTGNAGIYINDSTLADLTNDTNAEIVGLNIGIYLATGADITGTLTNNGNITGTNNYGIELNNSTVANLANGTDGSIVGGSIGIYVGSGSDITGTLTNKGSITGTDANGIFLNNSSIADLTNDTDGEITGGNMGISLEGGANVTGTLANNGNIIGTDYHGIYAASSTLFDITNGATGSIEGAQSGIHLTNSSITGTLTNSGRIAGETGISLWSSSITGGIVNSGVIEGTNGTAISISGLTQGLTMTLNGGRVIGDIYDDHITDGFSHLVIGDDFSTEGNIEVWDLMVNDGKAFTIRSGDVVTVGRMLKSASTISFGLDGNGVTGKIKVVGFDQGIDLDGKTVTVTVGNATMGDGAELLVGEGNVTVIGLDGNSGQASTVVNDNSILWDFVVADGSQADVDGSTDDTKLYLVASLAEVTEEPETPEEPTERTILQPHADSSNNQQAAVVLDELFETTNPELQMIWTALNNAGTGEELNDIIEASQGDVNRGSVTAASYSANTAFDLTSSRLLSVRSDGLAGDGISSGDITSGLQVWMQGFGEIGNQSNRGGIAGFDLTSYGFAAGVDSESIADDAVIGLSMGYSVTNVESDGANQAETDIASWQVGVYGDYDLSRNSYINGMISYGFHENDGTRIPTPGLVARSDYNAHQVMARVEVGRSFPLTSSFTVTPIGLAQASWYSPDTYTETGAGGANLTVDTDDTTIAELGLGIDASWTHKTQTGGQVEATVGAQYRYDFVGEAISSQMAFQGGGSAISSTGFDPAQSTVGLGAGLSYQIDDAWELSAQYDFDYKSDYRSHTGSLRAAYSF